MHFGGKDFSKILIIFDDDTEIIANDESIYREEYSEWEKKKFKEEYNERYTKTAFQKLINEKKDLN